jgi:glycosyltransferase involved in cell wall biosynthesis
VEDNCGKFMKNPLVSIIVPVYNAENYLDVCIHSILQQSYKNFECILIDDGSTDNSGTLCDKYAASDSRFKVIHQSNEGVSSARNQGLDMATGDWITGVDSDDWVDSEYINEFVKAIDDVDWVIQGYKRHISAKKIKTYTPPEWTASGNDIIKKIADIYLNISVTILRANCSKIYKRSIIESNHLRYEKTMLDGEDFLFTLNYLLYVNRIRAVSYMGYNYIISQSTLTKTVFDIETYTAWKQNTIAALIKVDTKFGGYEPFLASTLTNELHLIINACYLKNSVSRNIRLKTLSAVISLLTPDRLKYVKKKYFILKMYKIFPIKVIDFVLYLSCSFFRIPYKKIKKLK